MASAEQLQGLKNAYIAASQAKHPWPDAAAAESALESAWFTSESVIKGNNLLGIKAPSWWVGDTFDDVTEEQSGSQMYETNATWSSFPSWEECFSCQVAIQNRNSIYADALAAKSAPEYIRQVSAAWQQIDPSAAGAPKVDNVNVFSFENVPYLWLRARWSTGHARAWTVYQIWKDHGAALLSIPVDPKPVSTEAV